MLLAGANRGRVIEMAPRFISAEVDYDESVDTPEARVGDVDDALAGRSNIGSQVNAHVVDIGLREGDGGWQHDCAVDSVCGQIDSYELRPAICSGNEGAVRIQGAAGVKNPETLQRIDGHRLYTDEVVR